MGVQQADLIKDVQALFSADAGVLGRAGAARGLFTGTKVATGLGWRPVEALLPGDAVLTFDGGMQRLAGVTRTPAPDTDIEDDPDCGPPHWPLEVPQGVLGNSTPLLLAPDQVVMIESDLAEERYGDPFMPIPAAALEGWRGIAAARPPQGAEMFSLTFEKPQIVFGSGALLYQCPGSFSGTSGECPEGAEPLDFWEACDLVAHTLGVDEAAPLPQAQAACAGAKRV